MCQKPVSCLPWYVLRQMQSDKTLSVQNWNMCSMAKTSMLLGTETGRERPWVRRQALTWLVEHWPVCCRLLMQQINSVLTQDGDGEDGGIWRLYQEEGCTLQVRPICASPPDCTWQNFLTQPRCTGSWTSRLLPRMSEDCRAGATLSVKKAHNLRAEQIYVVGILWLMVQVMQPQRWIEGLWRLAAALEAQLGCLIGINAYMTPPGVAIMQLLLIGTVSSANLSGDPLQWSQCYCACPVYAAHLLIQVPCSPSAHPGSMQPICSSRFHAA